MLIHHCEQGSGEWHTARAGVITASKFACLRRSARLKTGANKGDYSREAKKYAMRLAIERIAGAPLQDDKFETFAMRRGNELEPMARACHEKLGVLVQRAGFVTTDCGRFGASVDGLIYDPPNGAAEYKCLTDAEELHDILIEGDVSSFVDQMQGGMFVTDAAYFHFGLYCPALEPIGLHFYLQLVERDDAYISELEADLLEFDALVEDNRAKLLNAGRLNAGTLALLAGSALAGVIYERSP